MAICASYVRDAGDRAVVLLKVYFLFLELSWMIGRFCEPPGNATAGGKARGRDAPLVKTGSTTVCLEMINYGL